MGNVQEDFKPKMPSGPLDTPGTPDDWRDPEFTQWVEKEGIQVGTRKQYRNAHRAFRDWKWQKDRYG